MCKRSNGYMVVNTKTGESYQSNCMSYSCPECAPKKAKKLKMALDEYLGSWKMIRMWTFTMTNKQHNSPEQHLFALQSVWHRFLAEVRRNKALREYQRRFSFVKVLDLHASGYVHYHVFISEYLPWNIVQGLWESSCRTELKEKGKIGHCSVKGRKTKGFVAYYVAKYVTKSIYDLRKGYRRWSKSHGVTIFPKKESNPEWIVIRMGEKMHEDLTKAGCFEFTYLELQEHKCTDKNRFLRDFEKICELELFPELRKIAVSEKKL